MSDRVSLIMKSVMLGTTGLSSAPRSTLPQKGAQTIFQQLHDKFAEQKRHTPKTMTFVEGALYGGVSIAFGAFGLYITTKITNTSASSLILGWVYPLHKRGNWWWQNSIIGISQALAILLLVLLTRTDTYERIRLGVIFLIAQFCYPLYNGSPNLALANACDVSSDPSNPSSTLVDCGSIWGDNSFLVKALIPQFIAYIVLIAVVSYIQAQGNVKAFTLQTRLDQVERLNAQLRADLAKAKASKVELPSNPTSPTTTSPSTPKLEMTSAEESPKAPETESAYSTAPLATGQVIGRPVNVDSTAPLATGQVIGRPVNVDSTAPLPTGQV